MGKLNKSNDIALRQSALNATDAMTAGAHLSEPTARKACDSSIRKQIVPMTLNGAGVRDTARILGINRNTVSATIKKKSAGA